MGLFDLLDSLEEWLLAHKETVQLVLYLACLLCVVALAFDALGILGRLTG